MTENEKARISGEWIPADGNEPTDGRLVLIQTHDEMGHEVIQMCLYHDGIYESMSSDEVFREVEQFLIIPDWARRGETDV